MTIKPTWLLLFSITLKLWVITEAIDLSKPILPEVYQKVIGQGFAVKYFTKLTDPFLENYNPQNIYDIYNAGFRNLRLRSCAGCYPYPYNTTNFTVTFLNGMETVVDKCLEVGVTPIISWAHGVAEGRADGTDRRNFIRWWKKVANKLKDKNYQLSFNLVTELGSSECQPDCSDDLKHNIPKYTRWMADVVNAIRGTGGNNEKRILILGPPSHDVMGIPLINGTAIYGDDPYIMVEHHTYAAGPTNKTSTGRFWEGCGNSTTKQNLYDKLEMAKNSTDLKNYWGAWMVQDNKEYGINQTEAECFAEFFTTTLKKAGVPWSLNALENYYDTRSAKWLTDLRMTDKTPLNFSRILNVIEANLGW